MAGKPPEVKILGDASGAKKAAKDAAAALDDYGDALSRAAGLSDDAGDKVDDVDEKISRFGSTADRTRGRVGDLGEELKSRLGPAGEFAGGAIDKAVGAIGKMPPAALAAGGGVAALAAGLTALAVSSVNELSDLVNDMEMLRSKSGMTLEEVSRLAFAMERTGVATDDLDEVMEEWGQGLTDNIPALEAMGVEIARTKDGAVDSNQTFLNFLSTLRNVEDPARRLALAQQVIGESAYRIEPAVRANDEAFQDFIESADEAGAVVDDLDSQTVRELETATKDMQQAWQSVQLTVARAVGPAFADFMGTVAALAGKIAQLEQKTGILTASMKVVTGPLGLVTSGLDALGVGGDSAGESMDELAAQEEAAAAEAKLLDEALAEAEAAEAEAQASTDALKDALRNLEQAERDAKQAHDDRVNAALGLISGVHEVEQAERAVERALIDQNRASRELDAAVNAHGVESEEARLAALNLADAEDGVEQALYRQATASAEARIKTAEAAGQHLDASGKAAIQREELAKLAATLEPGSPLRAYLEGLIGQLDAIPRHIPVEIQLRQSGISPELIASARQQIAAAFEGRAHGGPARAGEPYIVGEEGPELFVPRSSGTVVPNDALTTGGGAAAPMPAWRPFATPTPSVVLTLDSKVVARAQARRERGLRR